MCPRCGKVIKSTSGLSRHLNFCKILITLPSYQSSKLAELLKYHITNPPNLPSDNNKEDINLKTFNNGNKKIRFRPANTTSSSNNKDIDQ